MRHNVTAFQHEGFDIPYRSLVPGVWTALRPAESGSESNGKETGV